jgi:hypothetical protein
VVVVPEELVTVRLGSVMPNNARLTEESEDTGEVTARNSSRLHTKALNKLKSSRVFSLLETQIRIRFMTGEPLAVALELVVEDDEE